MPKAKKEKVEKKSEVMLFNYTIKAVIPTSPFANIQPEISVCADSLEAAEAFVLPHIDKLFVKYFNAYLNGMPNTETKPTQKPPEPTQKEPNLLKTDACIKAEQAINGCTSLEALTLVKSRIENSVKLTPEEKVVLSFTLSTKNDELYKQTNERNKTDTK